MDREGIHTGCQECWEQVTEDVIGKDLGGQWARAELGRNFGAEQVDLR